MKLLLPFVVVFIIFKRAIALPLIVPQELPSILSLIYSNIPPIKKGTDSRVGFGYRLGDHADFQVMLEIGPQIYTKKIGEESSNDRRRFADPTKKPKPVEEGTTKTWLQRWAQEQAEERKQKLKSVSSKSKKPQPIETMAPEVMNHLKQLYGSQQSDTTDGDVGTLPAESQFHLMNTEKNVKKITEDLSDIEFD